MRGSDVTVLNGILTDWYRTNRGSFHGCLETLLLSASGTLRVAALMQRWASSPHFTEVGYATMSGYHWGGRGVWERCAADVGQQRALLRLQRSCRVLTVPVDEVVELKVRRFPVSAYLVPDDLNDLVLHHPIHTRAKLLDVPVEWLQAHDDAVRGTEWR